LARQRAAEERRKAKNAQAEALTAERALKKLQRDAATAQYSKYTQAKSLTQCCKKSDKALSCCGCAKSC
jgi:hypothetical protein